MRRVIRVVGSTAREFSRNANKHAMNHDTNENENPDVVQESSSTVHHSWEEPFHPSVTIVEAVAAATGRTATTLPPLHDSIDPDALDRLLTREESAAVTVSFRYAGTEIVVDGGGTIEVHVDGHGQ